MRRAMTMIELLLAVSLLTLITLAASSWTGIASHLASDTASGDRWRESARAVLLRIDEDLLVGDFQERQNGGDLRLAGPGRIRVAPNLIEIMTRDHGRQSSLEEPAIHGYTLDPLKNRLHLEIKTKSERFNRPLLDEVSEFTSDVDPKAKTLTVALVSIHGEHTSRRFAIP